MSLFQSAVVCVAVLAICGCDRGQPADFKATIKAAARGDAVAQYKLGAMYDTGEGVPQDHAEALKCYRLAADQGLAVAQSNLGTMYALGEGGPQDYPEAVKWYRLAADQGLAVAQENLGFMYRDGRGVPQDDVETYAWFSVAAGNRFPNAAKGRDLTASKLTPEQLSQGQKRATELFEKISSGK